MTLTPPFRPLSKVPFPRPPARTCAFMTMSSPPIIVSANLLILFFVPCAYQSSSQWTRPRRLSGQPPHWAHQCHTFSGDWRRGIRELTGIVSAVQLSSWQACPAVGWLFSRSSHRGAGFKDCVPWRQLSKQQPAAYCERA